MAEQNIESTNQSIVKSRSAKLNEYLESSQHKSYLVGAVSIVFIGIFVVLGIVPSIRSVLSQNTENGVVDVELQKLNKKSTVMNALIKESEDDKTTLDLFNSLFPDQNSQEDVLADLYAIASENSVVIETSNFPKGRREVPLSREFRTKVQVQSQKINLNLEGGRLQLQSFIKQLESSKRIYNVTSIVITKKTGESLRIAEEGRDYDLSIVIEYFYWNDDAKSER